MKEFFEQKSPLYVFSTQRYVNEFYRSFEDGFLPQAMGVGEFFSSVVYAPCVKFIPKNIRRVFLLGAIAQTENLNPALVFERSFLGYLESSSFLFNFFDEMTSFSIDIKQIPLRDTYGDYEEHLQVLFKIYETYCKKLAEYGFCDTLKEGNYQILNEYFDNISCVEFYLDGFLSHQERDILEKISQIVPVFLHIRTDRYNISHFDFLKTSLELDRDYKINFKTSEIISQEPMGNIGEIEIFGFGSRISQVALVFQRVNEWLQSGIDPQKVAIITPSEDFAKYLKLLDKYNNLNLAMGKNIEEFSYIQTLKEKLKSLKETATEGTTDEKEHSFGWLVRVLDELLAQSENKASLLNFHNELIASYENIKNIFDDFTYADILELYLSDFANFRIDDTSGGKIRVMGVLESRGLSFDAVVIVDFNDQFVPSYKDSDMFLNTAIRKSLKIPTIKDRQDLQKHYYLQIFKNVSKIDIAFVNTESNIKSKMIDELELGNFVLNGDEKYTIFPINEEKTYQEEEIVEKIPSDFVFSASKLNTFFSCKRRFYYAYMKRLNPPKESSGEISSILHNALSVEYQAFVGKPLDIKTIRENLNKNIHQIQLDSQIDQLKLEINNFELENFWELEEKRASKGYMVLGCEKMFETKIEGFDFTGRIDRIDEIDGEICLIDYKLKSDVKIDANDFQLLIYEYGARSLGYKGEIRAYLYDLKKAELIEEESLEEKKQVLLHQLKAFGQEVDFEKTQDKKSCRYCPYTDICGI